MSYESCNECNSPAMVYDDQRGEIICAECGLVANSAIFSHEPEWRAYNAQEEKSRVRVGLPTTNSAQLLAVNPRIPMVSH